MRDAFDQFCYGVYLIFLWAVKFVLRVVVDGWEPMLFNLCGSLLGVGGVMTGCCLLCWYVGAWRGW